MSAGRLILVLLLVTGGLSASVLFASKAAHSLRDSPYRDQLLGQTSSTPRTTKARRAEKARARRRQHRLSGTRRHSGAAPTSGRHHTTPAKHAATTANKDAKQKAKKDDRGPFGLGGGSVLLIAGLEIAGGVGLVGLLLAGLTGRRVWMRKRREYALYELHLSAHDEAKPQDLEDLVESIAGIVRAFATDRARDGQPYVAMELICGDGPSGMQWSVNVRCEPRLVNDLDGAINATYPDVRLGREHAELPQPRAGVLLEPGHVMRLRKKRSWVYALIAPDEELASPPLEQIARAQIALGEPSIVRFQLTPAPSYFEELARKLYKRQENKLVRQERWGLPEGGLQSTLNRAEMHNAGRTQNRSLFWLELVIAADSAQACKTVAAAVQSRRGENRLHRRVMIIRQRLYRRRFPRALGPLIPSTRSLVSAAEVAHLLELPSARMKTVSVGRITRPRLPAPPELERTTRRPVIEVGKTRALGASARGRGLYPVLRAENGQIAIRPEDRKYGVLVTGVQGSGKTSALIGLYLSDIENPNAAPIVLDAKPELARLCLAYTPPDCGKRVWYLDFGDQAFGMNPLVRLGERPLALEASEIAENVVAALLDIHKDQILASSKEYLEHAVIGALALAEIEKRRPTFEDVHRLLEPTEQEFRDLAARACADIPDLDFTARFLHVVLPNRLQNARADITMRMNAPSNKISTLLRAAPVRRFFHHPTNITLKQIIEARDILIVNCAPAQVGDGNVEPIMKFLLRMLHREMQRQVQLPESERPRVPVIIDEARYVATSEHFVDMIATHRLAGLEMTCGTQYLAQLNSGSEDAEKIRKGITNLLQSRMLFRVTDPDDAVENTRGAMAVYSTMIRDDPDSRARMRVGPEQQLNLDVWYCLASWIAYGTRAGSCVGQTYELPDYDPEWPDHHLKLQTERVGPGPETLEPAFPADPLEGPPADGSEPAQSAPPPAPGRAYLAVPFEEKDAAKRLGAKWDPKAEKWFIPAGVDPAPFARWRTNPAGPQPAPAAHDDPPPDQPPTDTDRGDTPPAAPADRPRRREGRVDYEPPPPPPKLDTSPVRRIVGHPTRSRDRDPQTEPAEAPESVRELAFLDRINEIGPAEQLDGATNLPRLSDEDYAILALLDRTGLASTSLIGRATMPGRVFRTITDRLVKLHRLGLIARHATGLRAHSRDDGKPPLLFSLTARGLKTAQQRSPAPAISPKRDWRAIEQHNAGRLAHDLHALSWAIELHRLLGDVATDHWRTPRYATGRYPVPQVGSGRARHPITANELPVPTRQAIIDLELKTFTEVKPDLSLELRLRDQRLSFDLLVELDLTARASYNHDKFLAYDAFLCGWSLAHRRFQTQGTRPAVIFVSPTPRAALALAKEADEAMTGRIGVLGTGPEHWYHPGRDHTFFAVEPDLYHRDLQALALPPRPPGLRERLTGTRELELTTVDLLPQRLLAATE